MSLFKKLFSRRKKEAPDLPPEFLQASPPDWLIDARGQTLSEGSRFSIRAQLTNATRVGIVEIVQWPAGGSEQPETAQIELLRTEIDRLFVVLGFSFPDDIGDVAPWEESGVPVSMTVHRREPYSFVSAGCDLASWLTTKKSGPPVVEIGRVLMDARNRALSLKG